MAGRHKHNTGQLNQKVHCERYRQQNRLEKNRARKASRYQKFVAWCKRKWFSKSRTKRGTARALARKLAFSKMGGARLRHLRKLKPRFQVRVRRRLFRQNLSRPHLAPVNKKSGAHQKDS